VRHGAVGGSLVGAVDFEALVAGSPGHAIEETVGPDELCLLAYTSGTTGRPKGVMLTHGNVTWNVVNLLSCADFRSGDATIALVPFFRVGGTGVNVLPVLFMGGTVVVPGDVQTDDVRRLTEQHHVTVGFGNPDILESLLRSPLWPAADLSGVRFLITGGAPVPEPLIRAYLERGLTLLQGYGLSEAAPGALLLQPDRALSKVGSAGTPPLFVDTKIVGPSGADVGPRQAGELLVRGPNVMAGYWNRPEDTAAALTPDGWLRTGDAARSTRTGTSGSSAGPPTALSPAVRAPRIARKRQDQCQSAAARASGATLSGGRPPAPVETRLSGAPPAAASASRSRSRTTRQDLQRRPPAPVTNRWSAETAARPLR